MNEELASQPSPVDAGDEVRLEDIGHPRGTLAIVVLYGILFALGWLTLYLLEFLPRGHPTP